jgi:hypothetical protein
MLGMTISVVLFSLSLGELAPALVLHTSTSFGEAHVESTVDEMTPILLKAARDTFPDLPEPSNVKCQKWRYSQVLYTRVCNENSQKIREKDCTICALPHGV